MIEIYQNLFVGDQEDYDCNPMDFCGWTVIHACKEPYHRNAVGYTTRGAPKDSTYYFVFNKKGELCLNIVDADSPRFFSDLMMNEAISFGVAGLRKGVKVLVHCNRGESRSPIIALLILKAYGFFRSESFEEAESWLLSIYPLYNPGVGIREYARNKWRE
jgi:hypothetical protein